MVAMSAWLAHWPAAMGAGLVMLGLSGAVLAWVHVARGVHPAGPVEGSAGQEAADCLSEAAALWLTHLQTVLTQ